MGTLEIWYQWQSQADEAMQRLQNTFWSPVEKYSSWS